MKGIISLLVWQPAMILLKRTMSLAAAPAANTAQIRATCGEKINMKPLVGGRQDKRSRPGSLKIEMPVLLPEEETAVRAKKGFWCKERLLQLSALFVVLTFCALIYIYGDMINNLGSYGYLGAFLVPMLCSATIVVPAPGLMVIIALGAVLNPLIVGLISGVGGTVGEMSGYFLGYSGRAVIENVGLYRRLENLMKRWGAVTLFVLALIPNPIFDVAGAAAGALRFPLWKFLLYGGAGRIIKHTVFAFAGAWGIDFILHLIS